MPELPEVETVRKVLEKKVVGEKIKEVYVYYSKIIEEPSVEEFKEKLKGKTITAMDRRGKWLIFVLDDTYYLLTHLRMEGRFFFRNHDDEVSRHEHVAFLFESGLELRYNDTRKFGRMYLLKKDDAFKVKPLNELGKEPWDKTLTEDYLLASYKMRRLPIKTVLLDQSIITGIGNIYADEILKMSSLYPLTPANELTRRDCTNIINNTKDVLNKALASGGTTIRSYESSEGVHGRFQNQLLVHSKEGEDCPSCGSKIVKIRVGGRGTYYCPNCQRERTKEAKTEKVKK